MSSGQDPSQYGETMEERCARYDREHPLRKTETKPMSDDFLISNCKDQPSEGMYSSPHISHQIEIKLNYPPIMPSSLNLRFGAWHMKDDGKGNVCDTIGGELSYPIGEIDYVTGVITFTHQAFIAEYEYDKRPKKRLTPEEFEEALKILGEKLYGKKAPPESLFAVDAEKAKNKFRKEVETPQEEENNNE